MSPGCIGRFEMSRFHRLRMAQFVPKRPRSAGPNLRFPSHSDRQPALHVSIIRRPADRHSRVNRTSDPPRNFRPSRRWPMPNSQESVVFLFRHGFGLFRHAFCKTRRLMAEYCPIPPWILLRLGLTTVVSVFSSPVCADAPDTSRTPGRRLFAKKCPPT